MALKKKAVVANPTHTIVQMQIFVDTYGDYGEAGAIVTQPYNNGSLMYFESEDAALKALGAMPATANVVSYVAKLTHKAEPPKATVTKL